jgi:hypothetical protein
MGSPLESYPGLLLSPFMRTDGASVILRDRSLALRQHIHTEPFLRLQVGMGARLLVHANQHQERLQRNRSERVGSHAVHFAFIIDRDYRDSGCEGSERSSKFRLRHRHTITMSNVEQTEFDAD